MIWTQPAFGQVDWNTAGNSTLNPNTSFLGNTDGVPINFRTDNAPRMRLSYNETYGIGSFPNQQKFGSLLLCPKVDGFYNNGAKGPFSLLHLAADDHNAQQASYRSWMNVGINFTGNNDQDYIGQKARELDFTDMVAHWSDNPGEHLKDRFRFLFTSGYDAHATTGAQSAEGLEFLRMWAAKYDDPRIGIGDWYAANLADPVHVTEPSERLDIVNGRVRIRQLPTDPEANTLDQYMVVDNTGVVKWRHLPVVPPGSSCDWTLSSGTRNNVSTAFGPADPNCPDEGDAVGIGVNLGSGTAPAKLVVGTTTRPRGASISATMATANNFGLVVDAQGGTTNNYGIKVTSRGSGGGLWRYGVMADVTQGRSSRTRGIFAITDSATYTAYAGFFQANDSATWTRGVAARAMNGGITAVGVEGRSHALAQRNIGVLGIAADATTSVPLSGRRMGVAGFAHSSAADMVCYGVYGSAGGADDPTGPNGHTKWAGYFQGYTYTPGGAWSSSDEQLKENIEDLPADVAVAKLLQLAPKTFDFNQAQFGFMHLPTEHQYGLIAQEVEAVLPELVTNIHQPAMLDSTGAEASPAIDFKAMNHQGLIPLLIAGFQAQQQQIDALQGQLAQCCAAGIAPQNGMEEKRGEAGSTLQEQRLLIIPNPVADLTTLEYYVPKAGKVSLSVSTSDGKPLGTLREEQAEAGSYSYSWNTTKLAAGTYFCTYMLDGAVVVKRAVKVGR